MEKTTAVRLWDYFSFTKLYALSALYYSTDFPEANLALSEPI